MPKIENPHLAKFDEYKLSLDEWYRRRTGAFAQLRKAGGIPGQLLDLVERFQEQTLVQAFVHRPAGKVELRYGEEGGKARSAEMVAADQRMQDNDEKEGMTASETLAFMLRMCLYALKHAEKNRKAAPVRTLNLVPRSLIAEIAMDLLESCYARGCPPGLWLTRLTRELLNLERDRQGMSRDIETQGRAAGIVAQAPKVGTRELARALHVNASTISRWRRSPEFKQMVERKKEAFKAPERQWGLTKGEFARLQLALGVLERKQAAERAAGIVAQFPKVRTRELARALHVNASTISRWRRSPEFKQMVERKKEVLKALEVPLWKPFGLKVRQRA
jgi:transcriptional regulator with XRE-family HTH domain